MDEGAFSKAAKHLTSLGFHDVGGEGILDTLQRLHPVRPPVDLNSISARIDPAISMLEDPDDDEWPKAVRRAIQSFPPGSAGGPSGLRPSHLQDILRKRGCEAGLVQSLANLSRLAILGKLPEAAGPVLCASTLLPLRKDASGGVRPVAIGDTLRRLIGKCLLATSTAKGVP